MPTLPPQADIGDPRGGRSRDAGSARARADGQAPKAGVPASVGAPLERPACPLGAASEAPPLAASVARPAPKARILDTSRDCAASPTPAGVCGTLPGQRELGLAGYRAQIGLFDGFGYAVPTEVHDPDNPHKPTRHGNPDQLAFAFEAGGVQLTFSEWHRARDQQLRWLAAQVPRGKMRKTLRAIAKRGDECGRYVRQRVCAAGHFEAKTYVASHCRSRSCPASARAEALELRRKLFAAVKKWPAKRRGQSWFLHTVTVRRPAWTTIERLRVDRARALDGWRAGWKSICQLAGGKRAQLRVEVGTGGMVHVHVLAYHRYLVPQQLQRVRAAILAAVGGGTTQYRVDRVGTGRGQKGGVKEVAKYVCKGVAMNRPTATQTHPLLAAMVELAFRRVHLAIEYGDWDGLVVDDNDADEWHCSVCGMERYHWRYVDTRTGVVVDDRGRGPPDG